MIEFWSVKQDVFLDYPFEVCRKGFNLAITWDCKRKNPKMYGAHLFRFGNFLFSYSFSIFTKDENKSTKIFLAGFCILTTKVWKYFDKREQDRIVKNLRELQACYTKEELEHLYNKSVGKLSEVEMIVYETLFDR